MPDGLFLAVILPQVLSAQGVPPAPSPVDFALAHRDSLPGSTRMAVVPGGDVYFVSPPVLSPATDFAKVIAEQSGNRVHVQVVLTEAARRTLADRLRSAPPESHFATLALGVLVGAGRIRDPAVPLQGLNFTVTPTPAEAQRLIAEIRSRWPP